MRGFGIHPRCETGDGLRFAVTAPDGTCLPLRLLTQQEAETLASTLNGYADEDVVSDMLAAVESFQRDDYVMTDAEARALQDAMHRNPSTIPARRLPSRPRASCP